MALAIFESLESNSHSLDKKILNFNSKVKTHFHNKQGQLLSKATKFEAKSICSQFKTADRVSAVVKIGHFPSKTCFDNSNVLT